MWLERDPRFGTQWGTEPWRDGPLGIERLSHMTTVVRDLDSARALYVATFGGEVFHETNTAGATSAFVLVGRNTVVELAQPLDDTSRLATDLSEHGELPHSVTFLVSDLEAVERHAQKLGVGVIERGGSTVTLDPADCFGALWSFTNEALPGDPRTRS
jgi:hypothetical protein